jgi:hypothetical protein
MLQVGLQRSTKSVAANTSKKPKGGLTKWFKEDWRDLKTGEKCGRKSAKGGSKRPYPSCRPKAVAQKMTAAEKRSSTSRKTGPAKIKHKVTASGKRRK